MRTYEFVTEALKPSQYRGLVKGWDKTKYAELFDNKYRIYLPMPAPAIKKKVLLPNKNVADEVSNAGYVIDDYATGIAVSKQDNKRKVRIGKILKDPDNIKLFANDPDRAASKQGQKPQLVCISRHPYDIAGMSTDRGWTSCMNLDSSNAKYIPMDIKYGTVIAYLIDAEDKNIEHPQARMLIKPFVNTLGGHDVAFGIENSIYGTAPAEFTTVVNEWVDQVNESRKLNGIFHINPDVYPDPYGNREEFIAFGPDKQEIEKMLVNPTKYLKTTPHAPLNVQIAAVRHDPMLISLIDNPNEEIQLAAVSRRGQVLERIINAGITPSRAVQLAAVRRDGRAIQFIEDPDAELQVSAVKQFYTAKQYIKNPAPELIEYLRQLQANR
jgi:hypothetical protein